jgi:hypothetical protein
LQNNDLDSNKQKEQDSASKTNRRTFCQNTNATLLFAFLLNEVVRNRARARAEIETSRSSHSSMGLTQLDAEIEVFTAFTL